MSSFIQKQYLTVWLPSGAEVNYKVGESAGGYKTISIDEYDNKVNMVCVRQEWVGGAIPNFPTMQKRTSSITYVDMPYRLERINTQSE